MFSSKHDEKWKEMAKELLEGEFGSVAKDIGLESRMQKILEQKKAEKIAEKGKLLTWEELEEAKKLLKE